MNVSRKVQLYVLGTVLFYVIILATGPASFKWGMSVLLLWQVTGGYMLFRSCRILEEKTGEIDEIKGKYSVMAEDQQSRINSLQSQINPHFLYNTLECIRSEAVLCHNDSIAQMARALAAFFRYNISRKEDIVTVQDELDNIQNYIMIQNYRFENKFRFEVAAEEDDEQVYTYLIPKMTIQPIVENSIYHGLETKAGDCLVKITICTSEKNLMLRVSDNGTGMDSETLEQLADGLANDREVRKEEKQSTIHGNGVALYNVNQRIRLIFGRDYGLSVYSTKGIGTDVEIWLPIVLKMQDRE